MNVTRLSFFPSFLSIQFVCNKQNGISAGSVYENGQQSSLLHVCVASFSPVVCATVARD